MRERTTASRWGPVQRHLAGPFAPVLQALLQRLERIDYRRPGLVRGVPGQHHRDLLAGAHGERRAGAHLLAPGLDRGFGAQPDRVGSRDHDPVAVGAAHPGHHPAVVEAQSQHGAHLDAPADALDDPYDVGGGVALGHEVEDADRAGAGLPDGLQDERIVEVGAARTVPGARRGDPPVAVVVVAEQRRETGRRVETGQAEPVDGTVPADQGGGLEVADEGVVLDALDTSRHALACSRPAELSIRRVRP